MLERIWSGRNKLYWLLIPLSLLYGLMSAIRRLVYLYGWKKSWRSPIPIIVIGNLTAGGNGKTPLVIWLVEQLKQQGIKVGVVSRGYGGKAQHYPLLLNKQSSPEQAGDEPVLIYQRTNVPVAIAPIRSQAVQALIQQYSLDMIVTDDGLQHYALQRDIECVVIDGVRRFGNGWWLPAGPMRERAGRLKTVDLVIVNGGKAQPNEIPMSLVAGDAVNLLTGEKCRVTNLPNVCAMAGIGYPMRFFNTLNQLGVSPIKTFSFADHQTYNLSQLQALTSADQTLLMTEKDAVKCQHFAQKNWWYLPVNANISEQDSIFIIDKIKQKIKLNRG